MVYEKIFLSLGERGSDGNKIINKCRIIGQDIVNHCVNDILVHGALPITFLDYLATAKLKPEVMKQIVAEMAIACRAIGLPIVAGETAEMPDVYREGRHDVVGCVTGVVEKDAIIDGSKIEEGDILIGLPSNGLHTNGYSLARDILLGNAGYNVNTFLPQLKCTVGEELLKTHKCYFNSLASLLWRSNVEIHGMAHITGGGFYDNIGRLGFVGFHDIIDLMQYPVLGLQVGMFLNHGDVFLDRLAAVLLLVPVQIDLVFKFYIDQHVFRQGRVIE